MSIVSGFTHSGYPENGRLILTGHKNPINIYKNDDLYTLEGRFLDEGVFSLIITGVSIELPFWQEYSQFFRISDGSLKIQLIDIRKTTNASTFEFYMLYTKKEIKQRPHYEKFQIFYLNKVLFNVQFLNRQKNLKRRRISENDIIKDVPYQPASLIIKKQKNNGINNSNIPYFDLLPNDILNIIVQFLLDDNAKLNIRMLKMTNHFWNRSLSFNPYAEVHFKLNTVSKYYSNKFSISVAEACRPLVQMEADVIVGAITDFKGIMRTRICTPYLTIRMDQVLHRIYLQPKYETKFQDKKFKITVKPVIVQFNLGPNKIQIFN